VIFADCIEYLAGGRTLAPLPAAAGAGGISGSAQWLASIRSALGAIHARRVDVLDEAVVSPTTHKTWWSPASAPVGTDLRPCRRQPKRMET